jgi:hypothetical protein
MRTLLPKFPDFQERVGATSYDVPCLWIDTRRRDAFRMRPNTRRWIPLHETRYNVMMGSSALNAVRDTACAYT